MKVLDSNIIEPIIFKLALTDEKYAGLILDHYKSGWFEDKHFNDLLMVCIKKFYAERSKLPTLATVELIISKLFKNNEITEVLTKFKSSIAIDIDAYDAKYLQDEIIDYVKNNAIYNIIMGAVDEMQKTRQVTCIDELNTIASISLNTDIGLDYIEQIDEHITELGKPNNRLTSGWESFDAILDGGFYRDGRCIIVYTACTGVGKSLFMSNMAAKYLKMGMFSLIISLEMAEHAYAQRIDAHISEINMHDLKFKGVELKSEVSELERLNPNAKLIIKEFPPSTLTTSQLKNYIDNVIRVSNRKPDIIFVDYITLMQPSHMLPGENSYAKYGRVCKELRALSYTYNVPVITATQENRAAYSAPTPSLDNTSESMQITHDADAVFSIYQQDGDKEAGRIRLKSLKNRFGGLTGNNLEFSVNYGNLKIEDMYESMTSISDFEIDSIINNNQIKEFQ